MPFILFSDRFFDDFLWCLPNATAPHSASYPNSRLGTHLPRKLRFQKPHSGGQTPFQSEAMCRGGCANRLFKTNREAPPESFEGLPRRRF